MSRETSGEAFTRFMNDVNRKIFELVHSPNNDDKISGIYAIGRPLLGLDNTQKMLNEVILDCYRCPYRL